MPERATTKHVLTADVLELLGRQQPRVVVLGDALLDVWLSGNTRRLCREAPVPVVDVATRHAAPGGAANAARNFAALGADVTLVAAIGADAEGEELRRMLIDSGVRVDDVLALTDRRTVTKSRVSARDQLLIRLDCGDQTPLAAAQQRELSRRLAHAATDCAALIICDYGLGTLTGAAVERLRELRDELPLLVVDAHHPDRWRQLRPDVVTPNVDEAAALLGTTLPEDAEARLTAIDGRRDDLAEATGADIVVVTLDRDGAVLLAPDQPLYRTWAHPAADDRTAGAGDTFCAGLTLGLCVGLTPAGAAELGQAAADVAVRQPGTGVCRSDQLAARLSSHHEAPMHADALAAALAAHRAAGARTVFTNGCFDVVHRGHVTYLNQAKRLGDVLIVAVNSDASVARLKGPDRPVNTAADRAAVLAALSCVDYVIVFEEDTPVDLLRRFRPDVYAKGGDYTPEMLVETAVVREYGGEVAILDYVADQSTTAVLERIRATASAGE